ncbi:MAG TPA: hypothetical protein VJQ79_03260, partial [Acidimicrobiia bacterium]|nr:hypothetical protein [Acidimicrobiia bacterium]
MAFSPPAPPGRTTRFGIMSNGYRFPAWQASAIRSLLAMEGVEAAVVIIPDRRAGRTNKLRRLTDWPRLLWNLYNKGFVERRSVASRPVGLEADLSDVPLMACRTERVGRYAERFSDDDVAAIRALDLDFILRFGFGIIKGEVLQAPRWGVWSFHHGDERTYRGRPPGFWELMNGEKVVGSILQRLTERLDAGIVLYRGFFKPVAHSYRRTRDELFLGSSEWPAAVVGGLRSANPSAASASPSSTQAAVRRDPGNLVMIRFLARQAIQLIRSQWKGLTAAAIWTVGVADAPIASVLNGTLPAIRWFPEQGATRYLADPFPVETDGGLWALVEDYDYRTRHGVISALDLTDWAARPRPVIDAGVHASYPYVFKWEGRYWCIPETYQAKEVRLYRAVEFPYVWERHATLIAGVAALDSTVIQHDGLWWLFCTDREDGSNTKLRIWFAPQLTGPWTPHPL